MGNRQSQQPGRPKFDTSPCLLLVLLACVLSSFAGAAPVEDYTDHPDLVEVHIPVPPRADYAGRKTARSYRFGVDVERVYLTNYVSPATGLTYAQVYGANILGLASASFGMQWNTSVGAFYFDGIYGVGKVTGNASGPAALSMTKVGVSVGYMLDTISSNPYVVPFIGLQEFSFRWSELAPNTTSTSAAIPNLTANGSTAPSTAVLLGIAVPLSVLDSASARAGFMDYGIKNTFFNLYGSYYLASSSSSDPNFQSGISLSGAVHFEF